SLACLGSNSLPAAKQLSLESTLRTSTGLLDLGGDTLNYSSIVGNSERGVIKGGECHMRKTLIRVFGLSFVLTRILAAVPGFAASDVTIFGAAERQGNLTLQGTFLNQASGTQTITDRLNPRTFGVFGIRYGHGKVIGGEHTLAYAPNFIESGGR